MTNLDSGLPSVIFVTGTDTDVGKTITTAALAAALTGSPGGGYGASVAVYKPTQTGVLPGESGDVHEVQRLSGVEHIVEGVRFMEPMAPAAAAALEVAPLPPMSEHVERVRSLAADFDYVLVEGAGGLLVELDGDRNTLAELAAACGPDAGVVVVCRSGLGTLNHTMLTLEALDRRKLSVAGLVIGSWPEQPNPIELDNRQYLGELPVPFLGALPAGASAMTQGAFRVAAQQWLPAAAAAPGRAAVVVPQ